MVKEGGRGGGPVDTLCLPLDVIPGWLIGIQPSRVRDDIRPKLIRYRRECFRVLWDAFRHDILPQLDPTLAPSAADLTPAERDLARTEMLYSLARQQVAYERWLVHHHDRPDTVDDGMTDAHTRIDTLEPNIAGGGPTVTTAQAAVSKAVKAPAYKLGQVEPERGNPYPSAYLRLYRTFSVLSYKAIPLETFPAVMTWLADWWEDIADEPLPFGAHNMGGQLGLGLDTADPAGE